MDQDRVEGKPVHCQHRRVRSREIIAVAVMFTLAVTTAPSFAAAPNVVLGSRAFAPHGSGWGTAHPGEIFNGGDPSGSVSHIRLSCRFGGESSVREVDLDTGAAEVDHCDEGVG